MTIRKALEIISWVAGIVACVWGVWVYYQPAPAVAESAPNLQASSPTVALTAGNAQNQIGTVGGNVTIINAPVAVDDKTQFKKFVPRTYLQNLPKVKYNAYMEAHKYWDTGVTSQMLEGTNILADKLMTVLINLAETAYTADHFEGKSARGYYQQKIDALMSASYDAQPEDQGSMHQVMAHGDLSDIVDDFVVKIVRDVSEPPYFQEWHKKWNRAGELGSQGVQVDLTLTAEL